MPRRRLSPTPREMALAYEYEYTPAFAKWQRLLSPEQYEIAEVRTLVASVGRCCSRRPLYRPSGRPSWAVRRWRAPKRIRAFGQMRGPGQVCGALCAALDRGLTHRIAMCLSIRGSRECATFFGDLLRQSGL